MATSCAAEISQLTIGQRRMTMCVAVGTLFCAFKLQPI